MNEDTGRRDMARCVPAGVGQLCAGKHLTTGSQQPQTTEEDTRQRAHGFSLWDSVPGAGLSELDLNPSF